MKYIILTLTILVFTQYGYSQKLSKEEKAIARVWKKRQGKMKPEEFRKLVEDKEAFEGQVGTVESELEEAKTQLATKDTELEALKKRNADLEKQKLASGGQKKATENLAGTLYRVQIGAYRELDLTNQTNTSATDLKAETQEDGLKKYILGKFTTEAEAQELKKRVQKMGVKDAFIAVYKDGVRTDIIQ